MSAKKQGDFSPPACWLNFYRSVLACADGYATVPPACGRAHKLPAFSLDAYILAAEVDKVLFRISAVRFNAVSVAIMYNIFHVFVLPFILNHIFAPLKVKLNAFSSPTKQPAMLSK